MNLNVQAAAHGAVHVPRFGYSNHRRPQVRQLKRQTIDLINVRGCFLTQQAGSLVRKDDAQLLSKLLGGLVLALLGGGQKSNVRPRGKPS